MIRSYTPISPWEETVTITMDLPCTIVFTGDWHVGDRGTDHELLESDLRRIGSSKDAFVVLLGDLMENAIKSAPGGTTQEQVMRVSDQKEWVKKACEDWLNGRILGICQGNHEERSYNVDDFEINRWLAGEIGVPYMGSGAKIILDTSVGPVEIIAAHNYGGLGMSNPNFLTAFRNLFSRRGPADIIALAHYHTPWIGTDQRQGKTRYYMRCGTYQTFSRYSMSLGLERSDPSMPAVHIDEGGKIIPYLDFKSARGIVNGQ